MGPVARLEDSADLVSSSFETCSETPTTKVFGIFASGDTEKTSIKEIAKSKNAHFV